MDSFTSALYLTLVTTLNALEDAGEDLSPVADDVAENFRVAGNSAAVVWDHSVYRWILTD